MASATCTTCTAKLSTKEIAEGWCDNCGKKLPPALTRPAAAERSSARPSDAPGESRGGRVGLMTGMIIGAVIFALLMSGPLKGMGLLPLWAAGFGIFLVLGFLGRAIGRAASGEGD